MVLLRIDRRSHCKNALRHVPIPKAADVQQIEAHRQERQRISVQTQPKHIPLSFQSFAYKTSVNGKIKSFLGPLSALWKEGGFLWSFVILKSVKNFGLIFSTVLNN